MNNILVPIDFSKNSDNALAYAIGLGNFLTANIVLLNVEPVAVVATEYNVMVYSTIDTKKNTLEVLNEKAKIFKEKFNFLGEINCAVVEGDIVDSINNYVNEKDIDLVIMGVTGGSNKLERALFGSNAVSFSKISKVPVFIIPPDYHFRKVKNIAYACQYNSDLTKLTGLIQVKYLNQILGSKLSVVHIIPSDHLIDKSEAELDNLVEKKLETTEHKTYIFSEDDVVASLVKFVNEHNVDLIIMEPKKHSIVHKIFYPSITKTIAFVTPVPLITIAG